MKDNEAAEQAYLNAKRQYELDKAEQSAVESAYLTKKDEYDKIMNAYNEKRLNMMQIWLNIKLI